MLAFDLSYMQTSIISLSNWTLKKRRPTSKTTYLIRSCLGQFWHSSLMSWYEHYSATCPWWVIGGFLINTCLFWYLVHLFTSEYLSDQSWCNHHCWNLQPSCCYCTATWSDCHCQVSYHVIYQQSILSLPCTFLLAFIQGPPLLLYWGLIALSLPGVLPRHLQTIWPITAMSLLCFPSSEVLGFNFSSGFPFLGSSTTFPFGIPLAAPIQDLLGFDQPPSWISQPSMTFSTHTHPGSPELSSSPILWDRILYVVQWIYQPSMTFLSSYSFGIHWTVFVHDSLCSTLVCGPTPYSNQLLLCWFLLPEMV